MKLARYYAPQDLRVEEGPVPAPGRGELLVRVRTCATCGTDVKIFFQGNPLVRPPRVIGHEIAGEIAAVGVGVEGWHVGDHVQVIAAIPCGRCRECAAGCENICKNLTAIGYDYDGGYAEYLVVPEVVLRVGGVNQLPAELPFDQAALTEPLACVVNGQKLVDVREGDDVVVIGAGPIGCLHARLARVRGAARVILVESSAERLELAASHVGPDATVAGGPAAADRVIELTDGRGADVVIVAAASAAAQAQAVEMAAKRGRVSLFGSLGGTDDRMPLDSNAVHYRELTLVGAANSTPAQNREALQMIIDGRVPVGDLITETVPLEGLHDAIVEVARGVGIKYVVAP